MSTQRREMVKQAIQSIRELYETGKKIPPTVAHRDVYGQRVAEETAKELGIGVAKVHIARQFVSERDGYGKKELKELFKLIKKEQYEQDTAKSVFGVTHVTALLSVPWDKNRLELQKDAITNAWGVAELRAAIRARYGTRRAGGRRRRIPDNKTSLLAELERMCDSWRRWQQALNREDAQTLLGELPENLRAQIAEAGIAMASLHVIVNEELAQLLPGREMRRTVPEDEDSLA